MPEKKIEEMDEKELCTKAIDLINAGKYEKAQEIIAKAKEVA